MPVVASEEQLFLVHQVPLRRTIKVAVAFTLTDLITEGFALLLEMDYGPVRCCLRVYCSEFTTLLGFMSCFSLTGLASVLAGF